MSKVTGNSDDLWVFAYGSLMWNPGFDVAETVRASIKGYSRSFCMWSIHHRGTIENPGLVLALDPDPAGVCEGVALRVPAASRDDVLEYLRERELISSAYLEVFETAYLRDGRSVETVAYVMDQTHEQYTGALSVETKADIISRSSGGMGPNDAYLFSTLEQLEKIGCSDAEMEEIARLVRLIQS